LPLLAGRLTKLSEARRLNAHLRTRLMHLLSVVDAELFVLTLSASQYPYSVFYDQREVKGVSESEHRKLVQLFWCGNRAM
jgi:hypothetical protein